MFEPGITVCVEGQADAPPCLVVADGRGACLAAVAIVADIGDDRAPAALAAAVGCLHGLLERGLCAENLAVLVDDVVRVRPDLTTFLHGVAGEAEIAVALWPAPGANRAPGIRPLAAPDALALDVDGYARRAAVTAVSRVDASGSQRVALCVSRRSVRVSPWIAFSDVGVAQRTADALLTSITEGVSARDVAGALVATAADAQFCDDRAGDR